MPLVPGRETLRSQYLKNPDKSYETVNYGKFKIINFIDSFNVEIVFENTGYTCTTNSSNILRGAVRDPYHPICYGLGYRGVGDYTKKTHRTYYSLWNGILRRVSNDKMYEGVTICEQWKNFQNFCDWCANNHKQGYQIDKDLFGVSLGKPIYSPETCVMIPQALNAIITRTPEAEGRKYGVNRSRNGNYIARSYYKCGTLESRTFEDEDSAYEFYTTEKTKKFLTVVDELFRTNQIDARVFFRVIELIPNIKKYGGILPYEATS